jgi:signal transduction histidine kinase
MNQVMRQVEQGQGLARVGPVAAQDEIGRLAAQFDHLLDQVEDKRQRSEKLAAIGQLTAAIAHEINNPVAVMQGNLDLLRALLGEQAATVEAELQLLDKQVERMRTMVAELLRFARPSEYAGEAEALDLGQVMEESLVLSSHLLADGKVQVVRDYAATQRVRFNRHELQQLFVNLVSNAVQAMPSGGRLTVRTRDAEGAQHGAIAEVQDSGAGIPPAIRDQLFLPMFTTRREGNGLGLWLSQALVERHGGAIEVENVAEGGAVFRVRLAGASPG